MIAAIIVIIGLVLALFYTYKKLQVEKTNGAAKIVDTWIEHHKKIADECRKSQELYQLLREAKSKQVVVDFSNCERVKVLRVIEKRRYPELPRTVGYALDLETARMYGNAYVDHELWHVPTTGLFFTDEMRRVEPLTPPVAASTPHTHL